MEFKFKYQIIYNQRAADLGLLKVLQRFSQKLNADRSILVVRNYAKFTLPVM